MGDQRFGGDKCTARVWIDEPGGSVRLGKAIARVLRNRVATGDDIHIVCIGSDRSTGDCLGPLVGSMLQAFSPDIGISGPVVDVFGSLEHPVHARNLSEYISLGRENTPGLSIAVDACLGRPDLIGSVSLCEGPLYPGAGVHKCLPAIGDYHLTGTVNVSGGVGFAVLQSTRLHVVLCMATLIAKSILMGLALAQLSVSGKPEIMDRVRSIF